MINFEIKVFALPVPEPYRSQAKQLGAIVFSDLSELSARKKEEHEDRFCSQNDWYKFVFAIENGVVIGSVTTLKRKITFDGKEILLGGIGGVSTHPEKRNQGVASALLKVAMEELKQLGCDVAYLCTDIDDATKICLYEKFGFKALKKNVTYLGKSGERYIQDGAMIAPVNSKTVAEAIMNLDKPFDIGVGDW